MIILNSSPSQYCQTHLSRGLVLFFCFPFPAKRHTGLGFMHLLINIFDKSATSTHWYPFQLVLISLNLCWWNLNFLSGHLGVCWNPHWKDVLFISWLVFFGNLMRNNSNAYKSEKRYLTLTFNSIFTYIDDVFSTTDCVCVTIFTSIHVDSIHPSKLQFHFKHTTQSSTSDSYLDISLKTSKRIMAS